MGSDSQSFDKKIRARVRQGLDAAGLLLDDDQRAAYGAEIQSRGDELLGQLDRLIPSETSERFGVSLGLPVSRMGRALGVGFAYTEALAHALGLSGEPARRAATTGALFNLGIVLFDRVTDGFPHRTARLAGVLRPRLQAAIDKSLNLAVTGAAELDELLRLVMAIFDRVREGASFEACRTPFTEAMVTMFGAQLHVSRTRRSAGPPPLEVWEAMRCKSSWPVWVMGLVALGEGGIRWHAPKDLKEPLIRAGDAWWIADDLVDVAEDWNADAWSRPWWQLSSQAPYGPETKTLDVAAAELWASDIVDTEVAALVEALHASRRLVPGAGPNSELDRATRGLVQAWTEG